MAERTIIVDGFFKTYAMTGWRLGYAIMPERWQSGSSCAWTTRGLHRHLHQIAGIEALTADQEQADAVVSVYQRRRDRMVAGLNAIMCALQVPQGAFYVFPNIKSFGLSSSHWPVGLLDEAGVAVLAGHGLRSLRRGLPAPVATHLAGRHRPRH